MQQYSLCLSDQDDKLARQSILAPLRAYNQSQAASSEYRPLVIAIRDKDNQVIGGSIPLNFRQEAFMSSLATAALAN